MLIPGDYGEGGGAIVRLGVGLSVLTGKPIRIENIRAGRKKPGLKAQHLVGVKAVTELCGGEFEGELGSKELEFKPGSDFKDKVEVNIPTAGSVGLVLQVLQIACLKAEKPVKVEVKGGATFGLWAPPVPYLQKVAYPILKRYGYDVDCRIEKHGFYPKGGARVKATFHPPDLKRFDFKRGKIKGVNALSVASKDMEKKNVTERMVEAAKQALDYDFQTRERYVSSESTGCGLVLYCKNGCILGSDAIGQRGVPSEKLGEKAGKSLASTLDSGHTVDPYLADQLIPFMALAGGEIRGEITSHVSTNIWLTEKFLDCKFDVDKESVKV